ncbi:MAG TPA: hypothetical protein VKX40_06975, partial [Aequorivita sp.]|nr:hypothetical protein [Aequorivita sp.]
MRTLKTTLSAVAIAAIMASCGTSAPIIATPILPINPTLTKNAALTDAELKQWSAMDIVKDTVPG